MDSRESHRPATPGSLPVHDSKSSVRQWVYDPTLALGGPIGDVGSHCIDLLRFLLADEITQVTGVAQGDRLSGPLEAGAALSLSFSRGTFAAVTVSFRGAYRTAVEISGETGQISAENGLSSDWTVPVTLLRNGDAAAVENISNEGSYSQMLDAFSAWTQGGPAYLSPGSDALRTQQVLDAAYASIKTGRTIHL